MQSWGGCRNRLGRSAALYAEQVVAATARLSRRWMAGKFTYLRSIERRGVIFVAAKVVLLLGQRLVALRPW